MIRRRKWEHLGSGITWSSKAQETRQWNKNVTLNCARHATIEKCNEPNMWPLASRYKGAVNRYKNRSTDEQCSVFRRLRTCLIFSRIELQSLVVNDTEEDLMSDSGTSVAARQSRGYSGECSWTRSHCWCLLATGPVGRWWDRINQSIRDLWSSLLTREGCCSQPGERG